MDSDGNVEDYRGEEVQNQAIGDWWAEEGPDGSTTPDLHQDRHFAPRLKKAQGTGSRPPRLADSSNKATKLNKQSSSSASGGWSGVLGSPNTEQEHASDLLQLGEQQQHSKEPPFHSDLSPPKDPIPAPLREQLLEDHGRVEEEEARGEQLLDEDETALLADDFADLGEFADSVSAAHNDEHDDELAASFAEEYQWQAASSKKAVRERDDSPASPSSDGADLSENDQASVPPASFAQSGRPLEGEWLREALEEDGRPPVGMSAEVDDDEFLQEDSKEDEGSFREDEAMAAQADLQLEEAELAAAEEREYEASLEDGENGLTSTEQEAGEDDLIFPGEEDEPKMQRVQEWDDSSPRS